MLIAISLSHPATVGIADLQQFWSVLEMPESESAASSDAPSTLTNDLTKYNPVGKSGIGSNKMLKLEEEKYDV